MSSQKKSYDHRKKMRGKIIYHLSLLGYVDKNGKADFEAINKFIQGIGANNPRKVILNFLTYEELVPIVTQVEQMFRKESKNRMSNQLNRKI